MTSPTSDARRVQISQVARWRLARNLISVYTEIARRSGVPAPPSGSFGADDRPESLDAAEKWFDSVDDSLTATRFRSALAAIIGGNGESALYAVAQHLISKRRLDEESRRKIEFVLVQYFLVCSPPSFHSKTVSVREVAEVLQPLTNASGSTVSAYLTNLEQLAARLQSCATVREIYEIATSLEQCKQAMGNEYYEPDALVLITHAQHLLRLAAREVMRTAVPELVRQLEELRARGIMTLDCRAAGSSEQEPVDAMILTWKGVSEADIDYRIDEFAPALLGMEKVLTDRSGSNPQFNAELASLRAMAEKLSTQLAAISQRVQRLEILVPTTAPTPVADAPKWRPSPLPATPAPTMPIAMRTAAATPPEPAPVRSAGEIRPVAVTPQNGNGNGNSHA